MEPDETDWKIINILREEYMSNNAIALKLGVSEGMIRQRLKRLKEAGVLIVRALINPELLANQQIATIMANISESRLMAQKVEEISKLDNVQSVSIVSGRYDLQIEVVVDSNKGLVRFLTESLSQVDGISNTESFITLRSYGKFV